MKLCVGFLVLFLAAFLVVPATSAPLTPRFGVQVGADLAKMSTEDLPDDVDSKFRTGMSAGGRVILPFTPMVSLESGLFYAMKGSKLESGPVTYTTKLDYLTVPVLARMGFGAGPVQPFLKVGPEVAFLLSSKYSSEGGPLGSEDGDLDDVSSLDLGLTAAGGVQFPVSPTMSAFAQIGYTLGLMDAADEPEGEPEVTSKNRVLAFSLGVNF